MDLPALYDPELYHQDMHAWALHQAEALRRLRASATSLPNDLDLEHVAEEIADLGNEQRFWVESHIIQAMIHLVKVVQAGDDATAGHWFKEIAAFLANAEDRFTPSMRRAIDVEALWTKARRRLVRQEILAPTDLVTLPATSPFVLDEFVDGEANPRDLAARLSALIGKPG